MRLRALLPVVLLSALAVPVAPTTVAAAPAAAPSAAAAAEPVVAGQSTYVPVQPTRVLDTRDGRGVRAGRLGAGETVDLRVAGDGTPVPADATAVVINVTGLQAGTSATDVRVYPTPAPGASQDPPTVSNLNLVPGQTAADLVQVRVGDAGRVRLRNSGGLVHLIGDVAGYYVGRAGGSTYVPRDPVRLLDTRSTAAPVPGGTSRQLDLSRTATGGASGVPLEASAVVLNVTAVQPTQTTHLSVSPQPTGPTGPDYSNVNATTGKVVPNLVVVPVGPGRTVQVFNAAGSTHVLADLAGWFVPGGEAAVLHAIAPYRLLDTRTGDGPLGPGERRELLVGGRGAVPWTGSSIALTVTAVGPTERTHVTVYPSSLSGAVPVVSNLNAEKAQPAVPNAVIVTIGREGRITLYNNSGHTHLIVDVNGWYGPSGRGWDVSWPQCNGAGSPTSTHPTTGAFAVVGLTRSRPFTLNECRQHEWDWASSLPGGASVYINTNAPGPSDPGWDDPGPAPCNGTATDGGCGYNWGWHTGSYAIDVAMPRTADGERPFVWLDVEGPYQPNGPFWQQPHVNQKVIEGVTNRLRASGYRVGVYTEHALSTAPDWVAITGPNYRLTTLQNWLFPAPEANPESFCTPARSATGGFVVMAQTVVTHEGRKYDRNHVC